MSRTRLITAVCAWVLACVTGAPALAQQDPPGYQVPLGIALEGYPYPYPVQSLPLEIEGQMVRMSYMDVPGAGSGNGRAVVLFHGKNFAGDYWENTIRALSAAGFRIVVPDQIGFGKSSKPDIRYSWDLLAANTARLLDSLNIKQVVVIGNSMGGSLAVRFARLYGDRVTHLVLEDPLGLEDYRINIPPQATDSLMKLEMAQTTQSYRNFLKSYFPNWKPEFERFVEAFSRVQKSPEYPRFARASALTYQMIYEQPVRHELAALKMPTLLAIGQLDRTVFGRRFAPPEAVKSLGNFPALGKAAAREIPNARLVEFDGVGHVPHLEVPEKFHRAVLDFLN
jgi:pimeloyl-ACP methyl ester carboxylesterase